FHEKKLLKKVIFLEWKREGGHRENLILHRYHVTGHDDYKKYSSLCRMVQKYNMGVIPTRKSLALCDRLSVSSFCRRRLSTVLVHLKFAEHLKEAVTYTVTDPAFLVTRNMEDFITWVNTSKIRRKVLEYNEKLDDYDAMN
ncbi:hypothetical protein E1A91_D11G372800v1, partial [Gossypium mustelinum]